ncbi:MAG: hypothetical protein WBP26_04015 [Candidatus Saccharimonadales bacterium]
MAMFIAANPETHVGILQVAPQVEGLRSDIIDWVVAATHEENMKPVTEDDLLGSLAVYIAYANDGRRGLEPVGFLRQRIEDSVEVNVTDTAHNNRRYALFADELGTLIVKQSHRGRKWAIADELVQTASITMLEPDALDDGVYVPYALWNQGGGKVFDRAGYDTVGTMQTEKGDRNIKMLPPLLVRPLMQLWRDYDLGGAIACNLGSEVDRFAGMTVDRPDNALGQVAGTTFLRHVLRVLGCGLRGFDKTRNAIMCCIARMFGKLTRRTEYGGAFGFAGVEY